MIPVRVLLLYIFLTSTCTSRTAAQIVTLHDNKDDCVNYLENWLEKTTFRNVGFSVRYDVDFDWTTWKMNCHDADDACEIVQIEEIKVGIQSNPGDDQLLVFRGKVDENASHKCRANYLPFVLNKAVYIQLDHDKWGNVFVTVRLSGCDIWIVKHRSKEPIIFHVNANETGSQNAGTVKRELVEKVLKKFKIDRNDESNFVFHISGQNQAEPNTNPNFFHYKVKHYGLFYGFYKTFVENYEPYEAWRFVLKDSKQQQILLEIKCSLKHCKRIRKCDANTCVVQ